MKSEILGNIYHLYRSYTIDLILYVLLGCAVVATGIGVVKFRLADSRVKCILILLTSCLCAVTLWVIQIIELMPVYKDYKESSYAILEDVTMTVTTESSCGLNPTIQVVVVDGKGKSYDLRAQFDYHLRFPHSYTGTVVYVKHSGYVVWYDVDL